jgi:hypothetical protein
MSASFGQPYAELGALRLGHVLADIPKHNSPLLQDLNRHVHSCIMFYEVLVFGYAAFSLSSAILPYNLLICLVRHRSSQNGTDEGDENCIRFYNPLSETSFSLGIYLILWWGEVGRSQKIT